MRRQSFSRRFLFPTGSLLLLVILSYVAYKSSWRLSSPAWYHGLAFVAGIIFFVSLGFGTLVVYPKTYFRGASAAERIVASLVSPCLWGLKEVVVLSGIYTWPESWYFFLNPVNILLFSVVLAEMGFSEIICRRRAHKLGEVSGGFSWLALAAVVMGLSSAILPVIWGLGVHHFYIFQEGYKALFLNHG